MHRHRVVLLEQFTPSDVIFQGAGRHNQYDNAPHEQRNQKCFIIHFSISPNLRFLPQSHEFRAKDIHRAREDHRF